MLRQTAASVTEVSPDVGVITIQLSSDGARKQRKVIRYPDVDVLALVRKGVAVRNGGFSVHNEAELRERVDENR